MVEAADHSEAIPPTSPEHRDGDEDALDTANDDWGKRPACFRHAAHECLFVAVATMAVGMSSFLSGTTVVIPVFVARDLHMSQAELTWLVASSQLASGSFLLFFGRMADLLGQKSIIIASFFLFSVLSLGAGFARSPLALDLINALLGIVTAAAVPPTQAILSTAYGRPSRRKNAAFACFSAGFPVGFALGMVFNGIATQLFGWRAAFWLLAIIYLVLTIAAVFCVPKDTTPKRALNYETLQRFDPLGVLLTIAGIAMFSAALSLGPTAPHGWTTDYVLVLLILGFALIAVFVVWEHYYPHPLVPMYIWRDRNFSLLMSALSLGFAAFPPGIFFAALFFQRVWELSAISTAVHLLPMAVAGVLVNIFAGAFMHRINNKLMMFVGASSFTLAFLLLALNRTSSSYWAFFFPGFVFCVVGADLEFNVANMYVMTSLPADQQGIAGGIMQTVTRLFTTVGFGIITAIFDSVAQHPSLKGAYYAASPKSQPYSAAFFYSTACAAASVVLVFFLTIGTQGGSKGAVIAAEAEAEAEAEAVAEAPIPLEKL
ncbi:hypothetical protein ANO11243_094770 [Dothideomycetidae sp. 11243]|nr:hypothetical protein ANO11243_094770 [fungal sp. No.11243]